VSETVKATFNLPREELDLLRELAKHRSVSVTQVLRQAIVSEDFLQKVVDNDEKLLVEDNNGRQKALVFTHVRSPREASVQHRAGHQVAMAH